MKTHVLALVGFLIVATVSTEATTGSPWVPDGGQAYGFLMVTGWLACIAYFTLSFILKFLELRGRLSHRPPSEEDMIRIVTFIIKRIKIIGHDGDQHDVQLKDWKDFE